MIRATLFIGLMLLAAVPLAVAGDSPSSASPTGNWHTEYAAAVTQAQAEKRDLLVVVLGTEWSPASRRFDNDVLRAPQVTKLLAADFIGVKIERPDLPPPKSKPADAKQREFHVTVRNYPGVVLLDPEERCYFKLEAPTGGVEGLLKAIQQGRELKTRRDTALAAMANAPGDEQAQHLATALEVLGKSCLDEGRHGHRPLFDQLTKLDPGDRCGVQRRFTFNPDAFAEREVWPLVRDKKYADALECIQIELSDPRNDTYLRQRFLGLRFHVYREQENLPEAVKVLEQIVAVDSSTDLASSAKGYLDYINKPITLSGPAWKPEYLRFFFAEWRLDADKLIAAPGTYRVEFNREAGESISVRDVAVMAGETELVSVKMPNNSSAVEIDVPALPPGNKVWLRIHAKGQGWFGSHGSILITPKNPKP